MGKWRSDTHYTQNPAWDWKVYERGGSGNYSASAAWTDSRSFYDSLFSNASDWGLLAAKHDHVQENIPLCTVAMEELEKLGGEYEEDEEEDHWEERWCNADVLCVFPFLTVLGFLCYFGVKGLHHSMLDNDSICQPLRNVRSFSPDPCHAPSIPSSRVS